MSKKSVFLVVALCFAAFLVGASASFFVKAEDVASNQAAPFSFPAFFFTKNLQFGDNNQDVRQLQVLLNTDPNTQVAASGVGSIGQESSYFGTLSLSAVRRFQIKYGISPTGFVGPLTRQKLNQIISAANTVGVKEASTTPPVLSGPQPLTKEPLPRLYSVSPQQIKKTDTFNIIGAGFEADNTLHIGSFVFTHVSPQDSNNLSFSLPATSTISNGVYNVWLENSYGTSQISDQSINLTISDNVSVSPTITSVSISGVAPNETVTVIGTSFASTGNRIVSGFGTIENLSSDGTQISFSPRSLFSADILKRIPTGTEIKVDFYILSNKIISATPGNFTLKI